MTIFEAVMQLPFSYQNGSYTVLIQPDGKTIFNDPTGAFQSAFPDTIELKVTDLCNLQCTYCHEGSTVRGKHANLKALLDVLDTLPYGVSLAIGGGHPLLWPHLDEFLEEVKDRYVCNITVNALHIKNKPKAIARLHRFQKDGLLHGIGVSGIRFSPELRNFGLEEDHPLKHVVGHLIVGLPIHYLEYVFRKPGTYYGESNPLISKILLLGFKKIRRGGEFSEESYVEEDIKALRNRIVWFVSQCLKNSTSVSFDNLALEQLKLQGQFLPEIWEERYLGEEFSRSMYIDAVEQTFGESSTNLDRTSWKDKTLLGYFNKKRL